MGSFRWRLRLRSVTISGPRGGTLRDEDKIYTFFNHVSDILGLDQYHYHIDIIVHPTYIHTHPDSLGLCYENDGDSIEIHLARKCVEGSTEGIGLLPNNIYRTLAHELLHARQTAKGEYMYERPVRKYEDLIYELVMERM